MVRCCWVNFQCRGVLLIWIRVGQGPTALAVEAGEGCLDIFSLVYHFPFLSLGYGSIKTEILSQRAVKLKPTNQPKYIISGSSSYVDPKKIYRTSHAKCPGWRKPWQNLHMWGGYKIWKYAYLII